MQRFKNDRLTPLAALLRDGTDTAATGSEWLAQANLLVAAVLTPVPETAPSGLPAKISALALPLRCGDRIPSTLWRSAALIETLHIGTPEGSMAMTTAYQPQVLSAEC
jgi:hypothetical protein